MKKNVLADFHHPDLWWSFKLLFEKRLGWRLFRPVGMDWFDCGYHYINDEGSGFHSARDLSRYLLEDSFWPVYERSGYYYGEEVCMGCPDFPFFRGLELDQASCMRIDYLLCSTHRNEEPTAKLKKDYFPDAKIIRQVGNQLERVNERLCPNVLVSDKASLASIWSENVLFYHPEFDLDIARYKRPGSAKKISCFINHFYLDNKNVEMMGKVAERLSDYEFFCYGEGNPDGKIYRKREEVERMRESLFIWQTKNWDGYGFNIHRAMAVGRPVIVWPDDYKGKTAEVLLEDGRTCIFLEETVVESAEKIRHYSHSDCHKRMCSAAARRFREEVNFDREFLEIREFLGHLI